MDICMGMGMGIGMDVYMPRLLFDSSHLAFDIALTVDAVASVHLVVLYVFHACTWTCESTTAPKH